MRTRLGGLLAIVLGGILIATGATSGGATVGALPQLCGGIGEVGVAVPLGCPTGRIQITKVVAGDSTPPADGWEFTITSEDCNLFPGTSDTVDIPAAGGSVTSGTLFSTQVVGGEDLCHYTVTETAVSGWTATFNPTGTLTLGTATDVPIGTNDAHLTVTNTSPTAPTPTATVTTTPAAPSASPTEALAETGTKHVTPTTIIGVALVMLGGVMLFMGRKPRRAQS